MRHVAFLRAINVGGHIVRMEHLRKLFARMGFAGVETFIQSGNVFFDAKSGKTQTQEQVIEKALESALGYPVATFIRSLPELQSIAATQPFDGAEGTLYIGFLKEAPSGSACDSLLAIQTANDALHIGSREVYWHCRSKFKDATISGALIEKTLKMPATFRNVSTVRKMAAKVQT